MAKVGNGISIPTPAPLVLSSGNVAANWKKWHQQWTYYEMGTGLDAKASKTRVAVMLASIGQEAQDLYTTFEFEDDAKKLEMDEVVAQFEKWCKPRTNTMFETFRFGLRTQGGNESVDCYVASLKMMAESCDFKDKDRRIRDQLVLGVRDKKVQERILREEDPKLDKVMSIVRATEVANAQSRNIAEGSDETHEVSYVKNANHSKKRSNQHQSTSQTPARKDGMKCKVCGQEHERRKEKCPAWQKKCKACGGSNHFQICCRFKKKESNQVSLESAEIFNLTGEGVTKKTKTLTVVGTKEKIVFQIDTGAACNIISVHDYVRVTGDKEQKKLQPREVNLISYGGNKCKSSGVCHLKISHRKKKMQLECLVVDFKAQALLGLQSCEQLGIVKVLSSDQDGVTVNQISTTEKLMGEYADVFTGFGKLDGQYKIKLKKDAKPVVHAPRRVPVALREPLKDWLKTCEEQGIIAKVTEPTDWVSSITIVKQPNKLRMCLDPKELNNAIQREHYQLPTVEEVLTRLPKAKIFSVLDAKTGFWHVELDQKSSLLTTFHTPFGRYRWIRMPFGISSAPEVWQRKMHEFAEDLPGVEVVADDFLVSGSGDTDEEANRDHDSNLKRMLEKARKANLKLNREKARLRLTEVRFIGHLLTKNGVKMDPRKQQAIEKMPKPEDAAAVSRLLGVVQYLSKFLPNLSDVAEPLRKLTHPKSEWTWKEEHEKSFEEIKRLVISAPVLAYYDGNKEVTIQCDSSDKGIGAVLMQDVRPVAFSSRAMTKTEQNYAQIEKEMLAIVHSCARFHQYIYGKQKVLVESDHKPLEMIFRKPIGTAPKRLQRMLLAVQDYSLEVTYKRGKEMYLSDTLSRAYLKDDTAEVYEVKLINELESILVVEDFPNSKKRMAALKKATASDETLQQVMQYIVSGWPGRKQVESSCLPFFPVRDQLVEEDGFVFCGDRMIIPKSERKGCMKIIHQSHIGIEGCLRRAREYVYWPRMNGELKDYIESCDVCNQFRSQQQKEPLESYEVPDRSWATVSADIFELNKVQYLIVVDHYSNFFEYERLGSLTTAAVVKSMRSMFSRFGIPEKLITDNGRQLVSEEFEKVMLELGVEHVTSSPNHPQSNGKAENAVKTCKNLMKKAIAGKGDFYLALLDWRNTPSPVTGKSPAQLMFGRRTRSLLPAKKELLQPENQPSVKHQLEEAKKKQADYYKVGSKELEELNLNDVVRMKLPGQDIWSKGTVLKRWGKRSYVVKVGTGTYRRNRRQIRSSSEDPPEE